MRCVERAAVRARASRLLDDTFVAYTNGTTPLDVNAHSAVSARLRQSRQLLTEYHAT